MDSGSAVYCTLLLSDNYLPGAMVLAHSLRDNGTTANLVALFTPDTLRSETINELRTVYDELVPVHSLVNSTPANLWLMDRPDLIATFTKIELWRLTQFERIVYIDCDVVALRAPDELLALQENFAAVPDVGWPDCFNSGLMVLKPNMQDYYALKALAERGISFDGADQGLLNMHFRFQDWHRLSFAYNCTPSANYQYIPAYKHFQSTISLIHFIGAQKPWTLPRQIEPADSPYNQLLGRWWAVYDKHYRPPFVTTSRAGSVPPPPQHRSYYVESQSSAHNEKPKVSQHERWPQPYHVEYEEPVSIREESKNEGNIPAFTSSVHTTSNHDIVQQSHEHHEHRSHHAHVQDHSATDEARMMEVPVMSAVPQYVRGEESVSTFILPTISAPSPVYEHIPPSTQNHDHDHHDNYHTGSHSNSQQDFTNSQIHHPEPVVPSHSVIEQWEQSCSPESEPRQEAEPTFEAPKAEWDALREPPPTNSKPEAIGLEEKVYVMSADTNLFQPPLSYPEAPKNMYYEVPAKKPEPAKVTQLFPWESTAPNPTRIFPNEQQQQQPIARTPSPEPPVASPEGDFMHMKSSWPIRAPYEPSAETWGEYSHSNAWDDDPDIQRYIESVQQARRGKTQVISGSANPSISTASSAQFSSITSVSTTGQSPGRRLSTKITDFPTEVERPSLPVTPAPIQRFWGYDNDSGTSALPAAEGVPSQEEWNPLARLEELRRQQLEAFEHPEQLFHRFSSLADSDKHTLGSAVNDSP